MAIPPGRTLAVIAVTAVVSLGAGIGLSNLITSPAEQAANAAAPEAGPITVPVERRSLSNDVVMRADAQYEDPVEVSVEAGSADGPAVVTGNVPKVGDTLNAGDVILEVTGRPVILLTGELPIYRSLAAGMSGPDVLQLKAALTALDIDPGDEKSDVYDSATAAAVAKLYSNVGYSAPSPGADAKANLESAQQSYDSAKAGVAAAQQSLEAAKAATSPVARAEAQAAVNVATQKLKEAKAAHAADPALHPQSEVTEAQGALDVALAQLKEAKAAPDTRAEAEAVTAAKQARSDAQAALAEAQSAMLTPLPSSEIVYLAETPRRVDTVSVSRGTVLGGGGVMSVSGATIEIKGSVDAADAALVLAGAEVTITLPDDTEVGGTVLSVGEDDAAAPDDGSGDGEDGGEQTDSGRTTVVVVPGELTEDQRMMLQGSNVKITIPVASTKGDVLVVPAAALTAGPGGEARVEVAEVSEAGVVISTALMTVTTGLAADGYVEITPEGNLDEGDLVVVGATAGAEESEEDSEQTTDESTTDESSDGESTDSDG